MSGPQFVFPPPPNHLTVARRNDGETVTLVLRGEVDIASAPALERVLQGVERFSPCRIVLDLGPLTFIDSTGIHLLIHAQERANANGHQLVVTHVTSRVQRVFELTGLKDRLTIQ